MTSAMSVPRFQTTRILMLAALVSALGSAADAQPIPGMQGPSPKEMVEGCSNQEIADTLVISPHTARHHTEHVHGKLGVRSRAAAVSKILS